MPLPSTVLDFTSSVSIFSDKRDYAFDNRLRWNSIKTFIYLACTYSGSTYNFDLFSKICEKVRIYEFVLCEVTIGMPYLFMDSFIKQYTKKNDCNKHLNPLLRGISFGLFLQTALWTLLNAAYLADSMRYLIYSLQEYPLWTRCQKAEHCIPVQDVISRCRENNVTKFSVTSAHLNYMETFSQVDRHVLTTKLFIMALVWIFNFFFSTIQTDLLIKLFRLTAMFRLFSTFITVLFIVMTTKSYAATAFVQILDIKAPHSYTLSIDHISYTFGIGFLGLYDYGSVSPYTMVDNAVVAFTVAFTTSALVRAWIVRILYLALKSCVEVEDSVNPHYLVFAILPMSTEFLHTHKLYTFYIYFNIMFASMAYLTMLTTTMSKLLQSEFRSVKNIYIIGILCFLGFSLSLPIIVSVKTAGPIKGLLSGLRATVLYLGGFRVAVVMWVYGVQRFSTDIHFWLGFKPTKFWTMCWTLLPIVLLMFLIQKIYLLTQVTDFSHNVSAVLWIVISLTTVGFFQIKTLARYLVRNNLAAVFNSNKRYGPPDAEDRRKRENYDETISHRQCKHNCNILDDVIDCDHMPIMVKTKSTTSLSSLDRSMTNIYEADPLNTLTTSSGWFKAESDN